MRWSNDRYVSRPHRVLNRSGRARYAMAFFADPNPDTLIACLPTCRDEDRPAKYEPISYAAHQHERFRSTAITA
jgi:isopenicillin N synthase-like dioxygenase